MNWQNQNHVFNKQKEKTFNCAADKVISVAEKDYQHRFMTRKFYATNLIERLDILTDTLNNGKYVDVFYTVVYTGPRHSALPFLHKRLAG